MATTYKLRPKSGQSSFYGKAIVRIDGERVETLLSYDTEIITKADGVIEKHWDGWSDTTGRHIQAFCGLNKKEYTSLPLEVPVAIQANGKPLFYAIQVMKDGQQVKYLKGRTQKGNISLTSNLEDAFWFCDTNTANDTCNILAQEYRHQGKAVGDGYEISLGFFAINRC